MKEQDIKREEDTHTEDSIENGSENTVEQELELTDADKLAESQKKYDELYDSFLRLGAEFENYRKRTLKERTELFKSGSEKILLDVIPVVDDFERATDTIDKVDNIDALKEGVDLIYLKFVSFLNKHNVKEIPSIGEVFDTDKHEALTTIDAQSDDDKDKVIDCIQKGYTLDDRVIRYSKVVVAK